MNRNNAQPAHLAQHGQHHARQGQQQARPASAQPDQRPARALRTVTGLALLALAFFVALNGRGCLC